ncbi:MAG: nucleoside hydrolase [Gammaproteobacteria bacterium]|nr:nucleoside hydrolase [Gammaproteobacteria bacterium]
MIPVILDTDIGTDIDDTWALAMLLNSPELQLEAVVTSHGDTRYRALLAAKTLAVAGREDVSVAEGTGDGQLAENRRGQAAWLDDYAESDYAGPYRTGGAELMVDTIMASPEPVTVLCIGPASTTAHALRLAPQIATRARFVGMHGAVRSGYRGSPTPVPEYNVFEDVAAFRTVLAAPWPITITPLDTCGIVTLEDDEYTAVRDADTPLARALLANYRAWAAALNRPQLAEQRSTTLFDTVAVYLAFADDLLEMETIPLAVRDDGLTYEAADGRPVNAALGWRDLPAFRRNLVQRLIRSG